MLSNRVKNIVPSATLEVDAKAKQLKKEGKDVISFGAGEPDFNTPENIKKAAISAIKNNQTRYTHVGGIPELKKAISGKFRRKNQIEYDPSQVTVTCGGKHALYNAAMSLLQENDEAIIPVPYWVSFEEIAKLTGAKAVFCETDNFKLTANNIKGKITNKTKMLVLNSPNNPSGSVVDESEIRNIADLAVKNNIHVLSDEVYEYFVYGGKRHVSIASLNEQIKKLTITCNSVSKTYAMTGWRIGYCGADKKIIDAMENLQSHSTSNPTTIAQYAALEAFTGQQESISQMMHAFEERSKFMHKRLNEIDGIKCLKPEGAFYAFPDIRGTGMDSLEFSRKLLDDALVAVVPGIAFGMEGHVRLSYATPISEIERGLDRIEKWLKQKRK